MLKKQLISDVTLHFAYNRDAEPGSDEAFGAAFDEGATSIR